MDPAVASVCASGVVALFALLGFLASTIVPVLVERHKWRRETLIAERDDIRESTLALLNALPVFKPWVIEDVESGAGGEDIQALYRDLPSKHSAWELAVRPRLKDQEKKPVRELRLEFEQLHTPDAFNGRIPEFTEEILSLARAAGQRIGLPDPADQLDSFLKEDS